jgi:hypothetical protein
VSNSFGGGFTPALTKEQHDFIVERSGRPVTQDAMKRRIQSRPVSDGAGVTAMSDGFSAMRADNL